MLITPQRPAELTNTSFISSQLFGTLMFLSLLLSTATTYSLENVRMYYTSQNLRDSRVKNEISHVIIVQCLVNLIFFSFFIIYIIC